MSRAIGPPTLRAMLRDGAELALLDVREWGPHAGGHLLHASCLPLSRLELDIRDLVPRLGTRIVLCDAGDGLAERAAVRLPALGYTDIAVLAGGTAAWAAAGRELFSGVHVPSKAFGEFVEVRYETPRITAAELQARRDAGDDLVVLDSRPMDEYAVMNIPGGIDCPGAELAYRVHDLAPDPATAVVVNCAGRTRSIIGAQSLINAGIPNPVFALKDGTMGWHLAGYALEHNQSRRYGPLTPAGLGRAKAAAARVARRFGVRTITPPTLAAWRAEVEVRSLYLFDVRDAAEYAAGHLPGSRSVPGGQLVQETDAYVGTRGSRVVLIDDSAVRATMTASWLIQMGWPDVAVLSGGLEGGGLVTEPHRPELAGLETANAAEVSPADLAAALEAGTAAVIDLGSSARYREGHIPGAWFAIRARLPASLDRLPAAALLVFTSEDGALARFGAAEVATLTDRDVAALAGGTAAWAAQGRALASGEERMADDPDDAWLKPYHHVAGVEQRMRDYLEWEMALVDQIARDGTAGFKLFPA